MLKQRFALAGAYEGKTLQVAGHQFVDGKYEFVGTGEQVETLTRIFGLYAAFPESSVDVLQEQGAVTTPPQEPQEPSGQGAEDDGSIDVPQERLQLAEAIGRLDPAADGDWTSSNLPSLDALEKLVGKKVSRDEVAAVADGYTRAKARAARG